MTATTMHKERQIVEKEMNMFIGKGERLTYTLILTGD